MDHTSAVLQLSGYGVSFGARVILASVDLELPPTGVDVLMGPVAAGKSTLMRSLAGLNAGNASFRSWGTARLFGQPIEESVRPVLVQQHAAILHGTVREAVIFHARKRAERSSSSWSAHASEELGRLGLSALVPLIDKPLLSLPTEQQRAVNILSHALTDAPLVLVDEPTYGLGDRQAAWLVDWLRELGRMVRLVVVLHHQGQARRLADRVILLGGGRILAHEEVGRFFGGKLNAWVEQFVRSGSLSIASPDANPEDLSPEFEPPPPLPAAAIEATAPFRKPVVAVEEPRPPVGKAADAGVVAARESAQGADLKAEAPAQAASGPALSPPAMTHVLPPLSRNGVEDASMVGRAILSNYCGPQGFFWIVPGKLAGCAEPGATNPMDYELDLLARMGITHLVTLTEKDLDQDALALHGLKNIHLPIFDREAPSVRQTYMLLRRMQVLMDQGHVVAVHCKAGIGRTGTILAAWLIREGGISARDALLRLRTINPAYVQTVLQEKFLEEFEQDILIRT